MTDPQRSAALLRWYIEMGADEAIGEFPIDRTRLPARGAASDRPHAAMERAASPPQPRVAGALIASAVALAEAATNLAELELAVATFDGCALRQTATNTVFADGNPGAALMLIG